MYAGKREPVMTTHHLNREARDLAIEQALDAAMEIEEVIEGKRKDAPALTTLVSNLMGSLSGEPHAVRNNLLSNTQFTSLAARSSGRYYKSAIELKDVVDLLVQVTSTGVSRLTKEQLSFVREFCLGLNKELIAEAFGRVPESPLSRSRHQKLVEADDT
jgi:hypothetical protein